MPSEADNAGSDDIAGADRGVRVVPEHAHKPDALSELETQDKLIAITLEQWEAQTTRLEHRDSVEDRWERGSAVKLLLQHFAVREAAVSDVANRLRQIDEADLADRLEAGGTTRRQAISRLDEAARGRQAISLNYPEVDLAVIELGTLFRDLRTDESSLLGRINEVLGEVGERGLPSVRSVKMRSDTHPSPTPRWYDKVKPIKIAVSFYSHLRSAPSGVTGPNVDRSREHLPDAE